MATIGWWRQPMSICSSGRLRLNDTGRLFRDYVERSLGELEAGRRAVAEATSEGVRTVRLALETFLTLTGPLAAYKRAHPSVEVELHWSPAEDMARRLRAQDVDLCVASQPIHAEGLEQVQLLDEAVGVATPLDHPLAGRTSVMIDELADQPFVTARGSAARREEPPGRSKYPPLWRSSSLGGVAIYADTEWMICLGCPAWQTCGSRRRSVLAGQHEHWNLSRGPGLEFADGRSRPAWATARRGRCRPAPPPGPRTSGYPLRR